MKYLISLLVLSWLISPACRAQVSGQTVDLARATSPGQYGCQAGDLPNFHEVHPFLYRGGAPSFAGLKYLKAIGVATIIDLRGNPEKTGNEEKQAHALGLRYINLPMSSQAPAKSQVQVFLKQVEAAAAGKSRGPVFLHCAHGSDRTGCLVGIWRVSHDKYSYDQAYQEMRKYYFSPKFTRLSGAVKSRCHRVPGARY